MKAIQDEEQLLIFRVGSVMCCVSALDVDSIISAKVLNKVPHQSESISGVLQYREETVSIVNVFKKFQFETPEDPEYGRFIMAYTRHGIVGYWVDEVIDITTDYDAHWSSPPSFVDGNIFEKTLIWKDNLVLKTDFDLLFAMFDSGPLHSWVDQHGLTDENKTPERALPESIESVSSHVSQIASDSETETVIDEEVTETIISVDSAITENSEAVNDEIDSVTSEPASGVSSVTTELAASAVEQESSIDKHSEVVTEQNDSVSESVVSSQTTVVSEVEEPVIPEHATTEMHEENTVSSESESERTSEIISDSVSAGDVESITEGETELSELSTLSDADSHASHVSSVDSEPVTDVMALDEDAFSSQLEAESSLVGDYDPPSQITEAVSFHKEELSEFDINEESNLSSIVEDALSVPSLEHSSHVTSSVSSTVVQQVSEQDEEDSTLVIPHSETMPATETLSDIDAMASVSDLSDVASEKASGQSNSVIHVSSEIVLEADPQVDVSEVDSASLPISNTVIQEDDSKLSEAQLSSLMSRPVSSAAEIDEQETTTVKYRDNPTLKTVYENIELSLRETTEQARWNNSPKPVKKSIEKSQPEIDFDVEKFFEEKIRDKVKIYFDSVEAAKNKKHRTKDVSEFYPDKDSSIASVISEPQSEPVIENLDVVTDVEFEIPIEPEKEVPRLNAHQNRQKQEESLLKVIDRINSNKDNQPANKRLRMIASVLFFASIAFLLQHFGIIPIGDNRNGVANIELLSEVVRKPQNAQPKVDNKPIEPQAHIPGVTKIPTTIAIGDMAAENEKVPLKPLPSNWGKHVVTRGDTLWHLADSYLKDPLRYPDLARWSKISNPDLIFPGDEVKYKKNSADR